MQINHAVKRTQLGNLLVHFPEPPDPLVSPAFEIQTDYIQIRDIEKERSKVSSRQKSDLHIRVLRQDAFECRRKECNIAHSRKTDY